jgi:hypothetical protein
MRLTTFIIAIILTLSFSTSFGQDKTKLIHEIRTEFNTINNDTTLKKVVLNNENFLQHATDGGGQLTGFYKAGQLKKIVSWIGLSNGNETFEFYFKNKKLIFVYEQFNSFVYSDKEQTFRFDTTETTFVGSYYFYDNKLIDQITTGHNRFEDDHIDAEKTLLTEAKENKKLLECKIKNSH